jgi:A/G-specific adenine glycosylase
MTRRARRQRDAPWHVSAVPTEYEIRSVQRRVLGWGRRNFRHFPWRHEQDPWLTFLAEFLLQRTRAEQVASVFQRLAGRFPTPRSLLDGDTVSITAKLGLHFRVEQLLAIARVVVEDGGRLREGGGYLRSFMGVGDYTAAAWLSLHRGRRGVIVDAGSVD